MFVGYAHDIQSCNRKLIETCKQLCKRSVLSNLFTRYSCLHILKLIRDNCMLVSFLRLLRSWIQLQMTCLMTFSFSSYFPENTNKRRVSYDFVEVAPNSLTFQAWNGSRLDKAKTLSPKIFEKAMSTRFYYIIPIIMNRGEGHSCRPHLIPIYLPNRLCALFVDSCFDE